MNARSQLNPQDGEMLVVSGLRKRYGRVLALDDVSFSIPAGCIVGITGPNGAGKTTLFDVLTGVTPADSGSAVYKGLRISGGSIEYLGRLGIVRTFQDGHLPSSLTVDEYLALADASGRNYIHGTKSDNDDRINAWRAGIVEEARTHIEAMRFTGTHKRTCGELPVGEQKLLTALRAILRKPQLLLLDEPTQSFSADWVRLLDKWLRLLCADGSSVLLISHDIQFAEGVCDRMLPMAFGKIMTESQRVGASSGTVHFAGKPTAIKHGRPPLLSVRQLDVQVNGFSIVHDVSIDIQAGEIIGIIGPNGVGKSTLLKAIIGLSERGSGTVHFEGVDLTSIRPVDLVRRGLSLVLQNARLAPRLRVAEALTLCWNRGERRGSRDTSSDPWRDLKTLDDLYLRFPLLASRRSVRAGVLSAGEAQLLVVAMAIALRPRVLFLDEPSVGLHPIALRDLFQWLSDLVEKGLALVIVEQRVPELKAVADRMYELKSGRLHKLLARHDALDLIYDHSPSQRYSRSDCIPRAPEDVQDKSGLCV
jgi:ABC-type branched-subunit amino acid transport system ATPase component